MIPDFLLNPTDPNAGAVIAATLTEAVAKPKLKAMLKAHPDLDPADVAATLRFRSEVAFDVMRLTAENQAAFDRSLNEQAVVIIRDQLHLHHPDEYETAEMFFQGVLADTNRSVSEVSDLSFYARTVVPHMKEWGVDGADKLWVKGKNVKKARAAKPILNKAFKELDRATQARDEEATRQAEQLIRTIVTDIADENVTADGLLAKNYGLNLPSDMDTISGWKYLMGQGTVMILVAVTEAQRLFIEQSLGNQADWKLGDGHEAVLAILPEYRPAVEGIVEDSVGE